MKTQGSLQTNIKENLFSSWKCQTSACNTQICFSETTKFKKSHRPDGSLTHNDGCNVSTTLLPRCPPREWTNQCRIINLKWAEGLLVLNILKEKQLVFHFSEIFKTLWLTLFSSQLRWIRYKYMFLKSWAMPGNSIPYVVTEFHVRDRKHCYSSKEKENDVKVQL